MQFNVCVVLLVQRMNKRTNEYKHIYNIYNIYKLCVMSMMSIISCGRALLTHLAKMRILSP